MEKIKIEKPDQKKLEEMKVSSWPIWEKEPSTFDWSYGDSETCFILEGNAKVKAKDEEVEFGPGDLVTFPSGMSCVWSISKKIKKHYSFG